MTVPAVRFAACAVVEKAAYRNQPDGQRKIFVPRFQTCGKHKICAHAVADSHDVFGAETLGQALVSGITLVKQRRMSLVDVGNVIDGINGHARSYGIALGYFAVKQAFHIHSRAAAVEMQDYFILTVAARRNYFDFYSVKGLRSVRKSFRAFIRARLKGDVL